MWNGIGVVARPCEYGVTAMMHRMDLLAAKLETFVLFLFLAFVLVVVVVIDSFAATATTTAAINIL